MPFLWHTHTYVIDATHRLFLQQRRSLLAGCSTISCVQRQSRWTYNRTILWYIWRMAKVRAWSSSGHILQYEDREVSIYQRFSYEPVWTSRLWNKLYCVRIWKHLSTTYYEKDRSYSNTSVLPLNTLHTLYINSDFISTNHSSTYSENKTENRWDVLGGGQSAPLAVYLIFPRHVHQEELAADRQSDDSAVLEAGSVFSITLHLAQRTPLILAEESIQIATVHLVTVCWYLMLCPPNYTASY